MERYFPKERHEAGLPHTLDNMYEPLPMTVSNTFTFLQQECTYSGLTDQQLEENTGLTYFHEARVEIDKQADALMQGIYNRCEHFYFCYACQEYIGVSPITEDITALLSRGGIQLDRPHYHRYRLLQLYSAES